MQKKLIALAVAGIMAAPMAAQAASAEVYGKVRVSVGSTSNDNSSTTVDNSSISVQSHSSRFGVKGSQDLDNGLKGTFQIEKGVDITDQTGTWSDRNTYVGLAGGFGEVRVGTHDTPYKIATGSLDPWGDSYGDYNSLIGKTHDARISNVVAYISPAMNGFSLIAAYSPDINGGKDKVTATTPVTNGANAATSVAGMYTAGPLFVSLAVQSIDNMSGTNSASGTKLGVGYTLGGMTKLGFVYETDDNGATTNASQDRMFVSVNHDLGGTNLKASYGTAGDRGNLTDTGATLMTLGASSDLGNGAEWYVLYASLSADANATDFGSLTDGPTAIASTATGKQKASAIALGINLKFSSM